MLTNLKIKSSFPDTEYEFNESLRRLINKITQQESGVELTKNEEYDVFCPVYIVSYNNHIELKKAISLFNEHRYIPFEGYEDITANDFTISLESDNINESFDYLTEKNLSFLEEQINMLDYITSDVVSEQEDLKEKVDALHSFMQKSGILYYKQMVEGLLDVMDKNGLVNKESIKKQIFETTH